MNTIKKFVYRSCTLQAYPTTNSRHFQEYDFTCFHLVAAGVRRIEALTGNGVTAYYKELEANMEKAAKLLKANPDKVTEKIEHLLAEMKALASENESMKSKLAKDALGDVMDQVVEVKVLNYLQQV